MRKLEESKNYKNSKAKLPISILILIQEDTDKSKKFEKACINSKSKSLCNQAKKEKE